MSYEKINLVMMKILENKFGVKILPKIKIKEEGSVKTNETKRETRVNSI